MKINEVQLLIDILGQFLQKYKSSIFSVFMLIVARTNPNVFSTVERFFTLLNRASRLHVWCAVTVRCWTKQTPLVAAAEIFNKVLLGDVGFVVFQCGWGSCFLCWESSPCHHMPSHIWRNFFCKSLLLLNVKTASFFPKCCHFWKQGQLWIFFLNTFRILSVVEWLLTVNVYLTFFFSQTSYKPDKGIWHYGP